MSARHREHLLLAARERARLLASPLGQHRKVLVDLVEVAREARAVAAGVGAEA
jgi:hypothetical protein